MKRYFFLLLVVLAYVRPMAQVFEVSPFVYRVVEGGVEVIHSSKILSIVIPASVEYEGTVYPVIGIGKGMASWRKGLAIRCSVKQLVLPESLKYIGDYAFTGCSSLESLTLPEGLEVIGDNAFLEYKGTINLPSTVRKVGDGIKHLDTFRSSTQKISADLPEGIEELGASAFEGRKDVTAIKLPSTLRKIGKRCFKESDIESIEFGDGITHLPERLLEGCEELRSITIGESVKYIDYFTGYHDNTWDSEYGDWYEEKHHGIKRADFYVYPMVPPAPYGELALGKRGDELQAFGEYYPCSCTLHVPKGTAEAYRNAVGWKAFENIVDDLPVSKLTVIEDDADEPYFRIEEGRVIADGMIEVYALDGRLIASGTKDELTPLTPGLYVLRIDGRTAKAVVR